MIPLIVHKAMAGLGLHFAPGDLAKLLLQEFQEGFVNKDGTTKAT
jgi:hypothetical protein